MCRLKSCVVLKNRVFCPPYDSHQEMLEKLHIEDNEVNAAKTFVRVELRPPANNDMFLLDEGFRALTAPLSDWKLVVDQDILPDWWEPAIYRLAIEQEVQKWRDKYILVDKQDCVIKGNGQAECYRLHNCKNITLINTYAQLSNCKHITCDGGNSIIARDSTIIGGSASDVQYDLYGNSYLDTHNESPVWAYEKSVVQSYVGNIYLKDESTCLARGDTSVIAFGESTVKASGNSIVRAFGAAKLELSEAATAIVCSSTVECKDIVSPTATLTKKIDI